MESSRNASAKRAFSRDGVHKEGEKANLAKPPKSIKSHKRLHGQEAPFWDGRPLEIPEA